LEQETAENHFLGSLPALSVVHCRMFENTNSISAYRCLVPTSTGTKVLKIVPILQSFSTDKFDNNGECFAQFKAIMAQRTLLNTTK
jgi:hypothetical protein